MIVTDPCYQKNCNIHAYARIVPFRIGRSWDFTYAGIPKITMRPSGMADRALANSPDDFGPNV